MQLVAVDVLEAARGLSVLVCAAVLILGLLLGALGWRGKRFWITLIASSSAGVYGLVYGPVYSIQPLVAGLLLAVVVGALALPLARLLAYFVGGVAGLLVVYVFAPGWDQPILSVLAGGFLGVFLFRLWFIGLTSFVGAMLTVYAGLCILDGLGHVDMIALALKKQAALNWTIVGVTAAGVLCQFVLDHRRSAKARANRDASKDKKSDSSAEPSWLKSWWDGDGQPLRRAG